MSTPIKLTRRKRRMWAYVHLDGRGMALHETKKEACSWWAEPPRRSRRIVPVVVKLLKLPT